ncbi:hypothetical protein OKZ62_001892 [Vibrio navarrensis]|nr:hypothetical protein [Vibrio navarrensis]
MENKNIQELLKEAHMHTIFGAAAFLPAALSFYFNVLNAYANSQPMPTLTALTPLILTLVAVIAVYIQTIRHMRVRMAKNALYVLTCGVSVAALYVGSKLLGDTAGLFCATFLPYIYVRIIGHGLYKKDLALTQDEVFQANLN